MEYWKLEIDNAKLITPIIIATKISVKDLQNLPDLGIIDWNHTNLV